MSTIPNRIRNKRISMRAYFSFSYDAKLSANAVTKTGPWFENRSLPSFVTIRHRPETCRHFFL